MIGNTNILYIQRDSSRSTFSLLSDVRLYLVVPEIGEADEHGVGEQDCHP